jgi:hypothetical protein
VGRFDIDIGDPMRVVSGIHAGWNVAQPALGLNLGGHPIRIFAYEMQFKSGLLWSGGEYGPEASVAVTGLLAGVIVFFVIKMPKFTGREKPDDEKSLSGPVGATARHDSSDLSPGRPPRP